MNSVCMKLDNTHIVYVPPVKHNIAYYVAEKPSGGIPEVFGTLVKRIKEDEDIGRIIIFAARTKLSPLFFIILRQN